MGSRQIVLVSTAGFSVLNTGIFWREAKTKRLFSQCGVIAGFQLEGRHLVCLVPHLQGEVVQGLVQDSTGFVAEGLEGQDVSVTPY
jgi:hypothetical protein